MLGDWNLDKLLNNPLKGGLKCAKLSLAKDYLALVLFIALMHLAHAVIFSPVGRVVFCRLGNCFRFAVGLNFVARRRTLDQTICPRFAQIEHSFAIGCSYFAFKQACSTPLS